MSAIAQLFGMLGPLAPPLREGFQLGALSTLRTVGGGSILGAGIAGGGILANEGEGKIVSVLVGGALTETALQISSIMQVPAQAPNRLWLIGKKAVGVLVAMGTAFFLRADLGLTDSRISNLQLLSIIFVASEVDNLFTEEFVKSAAKTAGAVSRGMLFSAFLGVLLMNIIPKAAETWTSGALGILGLMPGAGAILFSRAAEKALSDEWAVPRIPPNGLRDRAIEALHSARNVGVPLVMIAAIVKSIVLTSLHSSEKTDNAIAIGMGALFGSGLAVPFATACGGVLGAGAGLSAHVRGQPIAATVNGWVQWGPTQKIVGIAATILGFLYTLRTATSGAEDGISASFYTAYDIFMDTANFVNNKADKILSYIM